MFRDCSVAREVWGKLIGSEDLEEFYREILVEQNLRSKKEYGFDDWGLLFGIVCWLVWRRRNLFVFEGEDIASVSMVA